MPNVSHTYHGVFDFLEVGGSAFVAQYGKVVGACFSNLCPHLLFYQVGQFGRLSFALWPGAMASSRLMPVFGHAPCYPPQRTEAAPPNSFCRTRDSNPACVCATMQAPGSATRVKNMEPSNPKAITLAIGD